MTYDAVLPIIDEQFLAILIQERDHLRSALRDVYTYLIYEVDDTPYPVEFYIEDVEARHYAAMVCEDIALPPVKSTGTVAQLAWEWYPE